VDAGDLLLIAVDIAREAGELARRRRTEGVAVAATKSTLADIVTEADREVEDLIRARLAAARPACRAGAPRATCPATAWPRPLAWAGTWPKRWLELAGGERLGQRRRRQALSCPSRLLKIYCKQAAGPLNWCTGTTTSAATAPSALKPPLNAMQAWTRPSCKTAPRSASWHAKPIYCAGPGQHAAGVISIALTSTRKNQ
jgi:hypothetical protein